MCQTTGIVMWRGFLSLVCLCAALTGWADQLVLGRLAQTTTKVHVYSQATTNSRAYYELQPFEYLIVRESGQQDWYRVPLQNGQWGWIKRFFVAVLPHEAKIDREAGEIFEATFAGAVLPSRDTGSVASRGSREWVAQRATNFMGTPYRWGGNDLLRGVDCSGFVKELFGKIGVNLPRTAAQQALVGTPIHRLEDLRQGDRLYFWDSRRNLIGHTGIYLGNGYFVHSSSSGRGVTTDFLGDPKWRNTLVGARR